MEGLTGDVAALAEGRDHKQGTLTPSPSGPVIPRSSVVASGSRADDGVAVKYPPGVPAGAVGGGAWSNQPSFSSYIKNKAVFDQSSGLDVRASRTSDVKYMPLSGEDDGCSSNPRGGMTHETLGSEPELISARKSSGKVGRNAFWYSNDAGLRKAEKYGRTWSLGTITSGLSVGLYRVSSQVG